MKGQLNQVFIYLLAAIIFTMVLLFGYKAIGNIMETSEYVSLIDFKTKLETNIDQISTSHDTNIYYYNLPSKYDEICFIDMSKSESCNFDERGVCYNNFCGNSPSVYKANGVVCDAWESNTSQNIFLFPMAGIDISTGPISIDADGDGGDDGLLCLDISSGQFSLKLEGRGDKTKISLVE